MSREGGTVRKEGRRACVATAIVFPMLMIDGQHSGLKSGFSGKPSCYLAGGYHLWVILEVHIHTPHIRSDHNMSAPARPYVSNGQVLQRCVCFPPPSLSSLSIDRPTDGIAAHLSQRASEISLQAHTISSDSILHLCSPCVQSPTCILLIHVLIAFPRGGR